MAGSLKIRVNLGTSCDPNLPTSEMVLSSTAEPDGGDHIATVNWGYSPYAEQLNIQLRVSESPETWIPAPSSFFFTSAGETYTLRTTTGITLERAAQLKFPYMVHALYAPAWAGVYDTLQPSIDAVPDDYCCDLPEVPIASMRTLPIHGAYAGGIGIISGSGTIDAAANQGVTMYAGYYLGHPEATCWPQITDDDGTGGTKTYVFLMDPGSYNWYEEAFTGTATFAPSNGGSASLTVTLTKPANSTTCTLVMTCGTVTADTLSSGIPSLSEVCATTLPDCTYPSVDVNESVKFGSFKLNCTTRKLVFYGTSIAFGGEVLRPANPIFCCVCENVLDQRVTGWANAFSLTELEIRVE